MFAAIFIPNFSLQAVLRHEPELIARAVALTDSELPKLGIIQLTARARSAGVWEGMTASQAMARCSDLVIKSRSPAQELAATEVLIQTAYAFSPFIESTNPGVCTMDLRGLRIVEDETSAREWAEEICKALAQFHLHSRIGFAATPELALLAANYHSGSSAFLVSKPAEFVRTADRNSRAAVGNTGNFEPLGHWYCRRSACIGQRPACATPRPGSNRGI